MPGNRGARFQPTPTRRTRSETDVSCGAFIGRPVPVFPPKFRVAWRELSSSTGLYVHSVSTGYRGAQLRANAFERFLLNPCFVAKSFQPPHSLFSSEPRHLSFRISSRRLLDRCSRLFLP